MGRSCGSLPLLYPRVRTLPIGMPAFMHRPTVFDLTVTVPIGGPAVSQFMLPPHGLRQPRFTTSSAGWQQKLRRNTILDIELLARNGYHGFVYVDQNPAQIGGTFLLQ